MAHKRNKILAAWLLAVATLPAMADGLPTMMKYYNSTAVAPNVPACKCNAQCNSFAALAKQWQSIPKNYRYQGFNIRQNAAESDGYGLWKGFYYQQERTNALADAGEAVFYSAGGKSKAKERIFAQGLAVLLYIEDKNGWAKYSKLK